MSVIAEILGNFGDYCDKHNNFKDWHGLEYYYDLSLMTANSELPAICYNVNYNDDNSEKKTINPLCRTYYREVGMRLLTKTIEKEALLGELWDFEEALLSIINSHIVWENIHPNLQNIKYIGTEPIVSVYHQAFREDYEDEWFCNAISVKFELQYNL